MSTKVQLAPSEAIQVCQSMDMILASPQSQQEYDNLKNLLRKVTFEWENAAIAGYKSDRDVWLDSGNKLNYEINWGVGEPNDAKKTEYCIYMQTKNGISINDDPCSGYPFPFICEYNHEKFTKVKENDGETSRFFTKVAENIENIFTDKKVQTEYFYSDNVRLPLLDAAVFCKSLGLDLFTPRTSSAWQVVRDGLKDVNKAGEILTSYTSVGSENKDNFYSFIDGKEMNPDWFPRTLQRSVGETFEVVHKYNDIYSIGDINIAYDRNGLIICQKSIHLKEETDHVQVNESEDYLRLINVRNA